MQSQCVPYTGQAVLAYNGRLEEFNQRRFKKNKKIFAIIKRSPGLVSPFFSSPSVISHAHTLRDGTLL